ncbi:EAL domain-containing protein [Chelativorans alearense]|uniref:EAL domain-containing protein n=1 Tax=Chelativorans alearense TaxID=2681495 RepID=UPI0013D3A4D5|nr:EAL domain-containing protein [Chelativorans alearense]
MFDHLDILDPKRATIVARAIADGRMGFAVQGVFDATSGRDLLYGECLARLRGDDGYFYEACEFIPCLDIVGRVPELDRRMLARVLDALEADSRAVLGCNLSVANMASPEAWRLIEGQIERRQHLAHRLVLELTESEPFFCPILARQLISQVRGLGCLVALDDFGCGLSNPHRLLSIPHDIVKIDAAYVSDVRFGPDGQSSLYHMVGLAACTAPVVIVEGIESSDHLEVARSAGATHVQGSFLAKPRLLASTL